MHVSQRSPVRGRGSVTYYTTIIHLHNNTTRIKFHDLGRDTLLNLRLTHVDLDRIIYADDILDDPPFTTLGFAHYSIQPGQVGRLSLFVHVSIRELGKHVSKLCPEEKDLDRDWDTLGTVLAHVKVYFEEADTVRPFLCFHLCHKFVSFLTRDLGH